MRYCQQFRYHDNVVDVYDIIEAEEYLLVFMQLCSSGDLFGFVQQAGHFPEAMARYWFRQLLSVSIFLYTTRNRPIELTRHFKTCGGTPGNRSPSTNGHLSPKYFTGRASC